uniref:Peptidyl-prolyl cis-trans isomerase n=1 Tax=Petromyzon marinus TaxID=7757 RepID=A0AAJ7UJ96_PETMA|nr:probable inactive peptidyl-prolyl cis-trans isomerase-like 6 [Petromyzon marinus]
MDVVFMDFAIDGEPAGRLLFELFTELCPRTCHNFRALCTGDGSERWPSYKGSLVHRVVPNGWIQAGDITGGRGNGGTSIYGATFEDESFAVSHSRRGVLGMANRGRHSNSSQFYVTLGPTPWMDRQFVAFGHLLEGLELLSRLEGLAARYERPALECRVVRCGQLAGGQRLAAAAAAD